MHLPASIRTLTGDRPYTTDTIGMSGARILIYPDRVLKIQPQSVESDREIATMGWLAGKLPVPDILYTETVDGTSYLLMSRLPGVMSCDQSVMADPKQAVSILARGLQTLWQVDVSGCLAPHILEDKLRWAEYAVAHGLCDTENVEPDTYGPDGFSSPAELLTWLKEHRPQETPVFSHGDYCLPNVFVQGGRVSGFLDLGRSGISDPYQDIALCYRSLLHNYEEQPHPDFRPDLLFEALDLEPDWEKIRYYILLDELF